MALKGRIWDSSHKYFVKKISLNVFIKENFRSEPVPVEEQGKVSQCDRPITIVYSVHGRDRITGDTFTLFGDFSTKYEAERWIENNFGV